MFSKGEFIHAFRQFVKFILWAKRVQLHVFRLRLISQQDANGTLTDSRSDIHILHSLPCNPHRPVGSPFSVTDWSVCERNTRVLHDLSHLSPELKQSQQQTFRRFSYLFLLSFCLFSGKRHFSSSTAAKRQSGNVNSSLRYVITLRLSTTDRTMWGLYGIVRGMPLGELYRYCWFLGYFTNSGRTRGTHNLKTSFPNGFAHFIYNTTQQTQITVHILNNESPREIQMIPLNSISHRWPISVIRLDAVLTSRLVLVSPPAGSRPFTACSPGGISPVHVAQLLVCLKDTKWDRTTTHLRYCVALV